MRRSLLFWISVVVPSAVGSAQEPDRLTDLARRRDQLLQTRAEESRGAESLLLALSAPAGVGAGATVADLAAAMRRDSTRLALLEELNRTRLESRFDLQAIRYQTGLEVLRVIIRNTEKLDFTTSLAAGLSRFEEAANPLNSAAFREQLAAAGKGSSGGKFSLPDLLLKNPVVSAAFSVASLLTSGLKPAEKESGLAKISCVLDFTTQANRDAIDTRRQLESIEARIKNFLRDADLTFVGFTTAVGAERDWARYKREIATAARSPVNDAIDSYFTARKAEALARPWNAGPLDELVESSWQLDQVRVLLTRHEDLLAEVDGFLARYEATARQYEGVSCPAIANLPATIQALTRQAAENRSRFRAGWEGDVPARSRAILFTAP